MSEWIVEAESKVDIIGGWYAIHDELVRCRCCKHYKPYQGRGMYCTKVIGAEHPREDDDYCSDGERENNADE